VQQHRIPYHEKTLGQLFCDGSAQEILEMLETECRQHGVRIFVNTAIQEVSRTTEFVVRAGESEFQAPVLVVATGGLSIPKMGATSFGYDLARQFGLAIRETRPALVPLGFGPEDRDRYCDLAGISADVIASFDGAKFREKMLITHRGLSGPAILQISSYWKKGRPVVIDLAPDREVAAALGEPGNSRNLAAAKSALQEFLPKRFANRWLESHAPGKWTDAGLVEWERELHEWTVTPAATEGYGKAEVTAGGVDTDELSPQTMECRKVPGLFFIGEVVDVTGQLGGFNFQWAWASGAAAGRAL
jgi:predicted Rossmann fold flavoprotein